MSKSQKKYKQNGILAFWPDLVIIKKFRCCGIYFTIDSRNIEAS